MEQQVAGHLSTPPPKPSALSDLVPQAFDDVIARGMAKNPDDRYATTTELTDAAHEALTPASMPQRLTAPREAHTATNMPAEPEQPTHVAPTDRLPATADEMSPPVYGIASDDIAPPVQPTPSPTPTEPTPQGDTLPAPTPNYVSPSAPTQHRPDIETQRPEPHPPAPTPRNKRRVLGGIAAGVGVLAAVITLVAVMVNRDGGAGSDAATSNSATARAFTGTFTVDFGPLLEIRG